MKQYSLHINNILVATLDPSKANVSADYELMDASSLLDRKSNRTQQFLSPATSLLQQELGFPENYNSVDAANQSKLIIGELKEDGETIISGRIKYHGSTIEGLDTYYRLSIVGDNNVWAYTLSQKRLRHLDLYDQTHTWTQANQEASETNDSNKVYCYPLVQTKNIGKFYVHGAWSQSGGSSTEFQIKGEVFPSDFTGYSIECFEFETSDYNNVFTSYTINNLFDGINSRIIVNGLAFNGNYGSVLETGYIRIVKNTGVRIRTTDRYPILRVSSLIERIFNGIGYRVKSDYNEHILSKKWLAYEMNLGWDGQNRFKDFALFKAGIIEDKIIPLDTSETPLTYVDYDFPFDNIDDLDHFDDGHFFDINTHTYSPRIAYRQNFQMAFAIEIQGSATLSFFINSDQLGTITSIVNQSYTTGTHLVKTVTNNWNIINETDSVKIIVRVHQSTNDILFRKGNCFFYNEIRFEPKKEGDNIYLVQHLPDINQLDLFKAIVQAEGLMIMTDTNTKTVYFENYDNFIDRSNIVDWTHKTDTSKKIEDNPMIENPPAGLFFQWLKDESDVDTKALKTDFNIVYGSNKIDYTSQFKSLNYDDYSNELLAPSYSSVVPGIGMNITKVTRIVTENNTDIHVARILVYDGPINLQSGESWIQGNNTRTVAPLAYFQDDANENENSLHYEDGLNTIGLTKRNFGTLQKEINESRLISLYQVLNAYDIAQFVNIDDELKRDFRAAFLIRTLYGKYLCRLVKIENYNPDDSSTKCKFIKLTDRIFFYEHPSGNTPPEEDENNNSQV